MTESARQAARNRVLELANDPQFRPFIIGYLLGCLDERHWEALAEAAVQFAADNVRRQREAVERLEGLHSRRG